MALYENFMNEMRMIAQNQPAIQYFVVGVVLLPISFGALNNMMIFALFFGIGIGCLLLAHTTSIDYEKKRKEQKARADELKTIAEMARK